MHAVIRHRGPDGEGFLIADGDGAVVRSETADRLAELASPRVGFAFRRLKICDLSEAANQPMGSADQKTWVATWKENDSLCLNMGPPFRPMHETPATVNSTVITSPTLPDG